MKKLSYGYANEIPAIKERCENDVFENAIRRIGVIAACEWFGHRPDSEFTIETIRVLKARSKVKGD